MGLFSRIGRWFSNMFTTKDIEEVLGVTVATSNEMLEAQEIWRNVFRGLADWNNSVPSLMLASGICTEVARAVTIEAETEIVGSPRAEWLNEQYQEFFKDIRKTTEKLTSNGTILLVPDIKENLSLIVEVFENNMYKPIRYDKNGRLIEVVVQYSIVGDDEYYTLFKHIVFEDNNLTFYFIAFVSKSADVIGKEIPLSQIKEWSYLENANGLTFTQVVNPWFVTLNMPALNHIEQDSPQGMAIFSKSIDDLEKADIQEDRTDWEFEGGELAIDASIDLFRNVGSNKPGARDTNRIELPKGKERLFRSHNIEGEKFQMKTFNPDFRDVSLNNRQNEIRRHIEFNCGLSYGIISDPQTQEKTATEIEAGKQRFYTTVSDIQKVIENGCRELVAIMDDMATRYYLAPQGEYDISFWWDDSILVSAEDKQKMFDTELNRLKTLQSMGAIDIAELRAFYKENSDYFSKLSPEMIEEARLELPSVLEEGVE